jgi:hypothetical protein
MAVINGTITGVTLLRAKGSRKTYHVTAAFGAYTGAADTATITGIGAAIATKTRNGKTNTLRAVAPMAAGSDTNAQDVYFGGTAVQAATISSDDATGQLNNAAGTELTTATASVGVEVIAVVDES